MKAVRLSTWAKNNGFQYRGAYNAFVMGNIPGAYQLPSGSIMVKEISTKPDKTIVYARVSSPKQKADLNSQAIRISDFCAANGWSVDEIYKETASGLNDNRKLLNRILDDKSVTRIVVEHKDRFTRFGFNYLEKLLGQQECKIVVINKVVEDQDDLMTDFVSLITSMVARLYGQRRTLRRTQEIIDRLKVQNDSHE
jgi:predicted site-specific integrase-resolvase